MELRKIIDSSKTSGIHLGNAEILTINWRNGPHPIFRAMDASRAFRTVDKHYFALATVGEHYPLIESQLSDTLESYVTCKDPQGNLYFSNYKDETLYGFTPQGKQILNWQPNDIGNGHPIYDIAYEAPDYLWLAFPTGATVTKVSLSQQKEVFRIGSYAYEEPFGLLSFPESISIQGEYLMIPNMGNEKLFQFHLPTKDIQLIATFDQKIWQYQHTDFGTFVVLDGGIYEIISGMPFR